MPKPVPQEGQVLLRVRAVGICGSDLHYYREGGTGEAVIEEPLILGHEFSAEVAELGPGVAGFAVGQKVAVDPADPCGHCEFCIEGNSNICPQVVFRGTVGVDGAMREYLAYPARLLHTLPENMTYADGAVLEPLGVGVHAVDLGKQRTAATVAVLGCGPIGLLTMQVAKAAGASKVYATELLPYRLEAAKANGADHIYDAAREDLVEAILADTNGRGVDVVYECAGAQETPQQAAAICKPGGTVVLVGIPSVDRTAFIASTARRKGLTFKAARRMREVYPRSIALVESGLCEVRSVVTHHFPLDKVAEAMELLDGYGGGAIKIMLDI
jgi:L-iditol 2-dehydrogenase